MKHNVNWRSFGEEAAREDPAELFSKIRAVGEVVSLRVPLVGLTWLTTSRRPTAQMLKDDARFSLRRKKGHGVEGIAGMGWWAPASLRMVASNMLTCDEPDQTRLRATVHCAIPIRASLKNRADARASACGGLSVCSSA